MQITLATATVYLGEDAYYGWLLLAGNTLSLYLVFGVFIPKSKRKDN